MSEVTCVSTAAAVLGEGTLWDPDRQVVWWLDIKSAVLHAHDVNTGANRRQALEHRLTALGLTDRGDLIGCGDAGFVRLCVAADGRVRVVEILARPDEPAGNRFNDAKVDSAGRFWAGTMDDAERESCGSLYRLDARSLTQVRSGIAVPNGPCFLADGTMLATDTAAGIITAYTLDAAGNPRSERAFARFAPEDGYPDGMTVDAEDHVWVAFWDGACLRRVDPDGRVVQNIPLPVQRPTCPVFGGAALDRLYVASALIGLDAAALTLQPWSGGLLRLDVGVSGVPPSRFSLS
ncbi:MAG: SMP-30/gluconolactonase/LRE family protein [Casimicrobiaceae bacterium]